MPRWSQNIQATERTAHITEVTIYLRLLTRREGEEDTLELFTASPGPISRLEGQDRDHVRSSTEAEPAKIC
jgi:hypothetical protein